jgi:hypothetical protein
VQTYLLTRPDLFLLNGKQVFLLAEPHEAVDPADDLTSKMEDLSVEEDPETADALMSSEWGCW